MLSRVIAEHLEAFLETARRNTDGLSLPEFVEQEFRGFLTCGVLAHGFARLRCSDCALERLVPFSCCLELKTIWSLSPSAVANRVISRHVGAGGGRASPDSFSRG